MIVQLLERLLQEGVAHDATATQRDRMMLNITAATGQFSDLDSLVLPIGKGQLVIRRRSDVQP